MNTTHPTTDQQWRDNFVIALRLRAISGRAIGDALAEANQHAADTGQTLVTAFGDPDAYAATLEFAPSARVAALPTLLTLACIVVASLSIQVVPATMGALTHGRDVTVTLGIVLGMVATLALMGAGVVGIEWAVKRPWTTGAVVAASLLGIVALLALVRSPSWQVAPLIPGLLGIAALIASTAFLVTRSRKEKPDYLVDPLTGPKRGGTAERILFNWGALAFPLVTAIFTAAYILK